MHQSYRTSLWFILVVIVVVTAVQVINSGVGGALNQLGLLPRHTSHMLGLFTYPFLHGSWAHLFNNIVSFVILSVLISRNGIKRLVSVFMISWLFSAIGVWLFGRLNYHVGLSGIIYGFWAYLLVYAAMYRSVKSLLIALIVIVFYGSMVWGVLPGHSWISYESHFFGALSGGLAGYLFAKRDTRKHQ